MLSRDELKEIQERLNKATLGPWAWTVAGDGWPGPQLEGNIKNADMNPVLIASGCTNDKGGRDKVKGCIPEKSDDPLWACPLHPSAEDRDFIAHAYKDIERLLAHADADYRVGVETSQGQTGPYIMVPVQQIDDVRTLLAANNIFYWVDEDAISLDGKPEMTVVNLGHGSDVTSVQNILDNALPRQPRVAETVGSSQNILQSLQTCLKVVRDKNKPEYEIVLSKLCEELNLNPVGTKCECGADLSMSLKEVTGCGNCDPQ